MPPPQEIRPYSETINHWFPLIRPAIRAGYFLGGWPKRGAPLDSYEIIRILYVDLFPEFENQGLQYSIPKA